MGGSREVGGSLTEKGGKSERGKHNQEPVPRCTMGFDRLHELIQELPASREVEMINILGELPSLLPNGVLYRSQNHPTWPFLLHSKVPQILRDFRVRDRPKGPLASWLGSFGQNLSALLAAAQAFRFLFPSI